MFFCCLAKEFYRNYTVLVAFTTGVSLIRIFEVFVIFSHYKNYFAGVEFSDMLLILLALYNLFNLMANWIFSPVNINTETVIFIVTKHHFQPKSLHFTCSVCFCVKLLSLFTWFLLFSNRFAIRTMVYMLSELQYTPKRSTLRVFNFFQVLYKNIYHWFTTINY